MRVDPEELVELKNHGSMKLRCAVARAMFLPPTERRQVAIVRQVEPSVLKFKTIKDLSSQLERRRKPRKGKHTSKRSRVRTASPTRKPHSRARVA